MKQRQQQNTATGYHKSLNNYLFVNPTKTAEQNAKKLLSFSDHERSFVEARAQIEAGNCPSWRRTGNREQSFWIGIISEATHTMGRSARTSEECERNPPLVAETVVPPSGGR